MKTIFIYISLIAFVITTGCESHKKEHEHKETKFLVTKPVLKDTITIREYVCQIKSIQHIELRALEKGYLESIYVDEGQFVKKGTLMFQIMPLQYRAEYQKSKAEANFAEIEYLNTKRLAESDVVSDNELALAKAKYDKALAELSLSEVHLGFTEIHAPFDGIMDRFNVRLGSLVEEGELLTTLSDNSSIWVYFNVPEAEYIDYMRHGKKENMQKVSLIMANGEPFDYTGVVSTIEADFNNETGNIAFRATFPNPDGLLRHGETGNIRIAAPIKNALIIPQKATFEILDKKYVFIVDKDNKVRLRNIVVADELPHLYIISKGITESDVILLEGIRKVKENDSISYHLLLSDSVISHLNLYAE